MQLRPILAFLLLPYAASLAAEVSFNRDIRPILSDACFSCHGPDKKARKADRRLDTQDGALAEIDGVRAIVPGDLAKSDLVARITSQDPDEMMPPKKSDKKLTPAQIALLKDWVSQGAKYEKHWALIPPVRPALPAVDKSNARVQTPIDAFIGAQLEKAGLKMSPQASPETLCRRLYYDLTGLPPTPAEVEAFVKEAALDSQAAIKGLVDRLLASPRYGEKMAVHWLDLSRYADTHGFHLDSGREQWPWRDWVIGSFNKNQRFDEFVAWQLAGDLMPNATDEQKLATGFLRNNMINFEGGAIADEYLAAYVKDRVNTVGTAFLGLTVGCAECHDHKFDPITQRDFYQFYAYFNAVPEKGLDGSEGNAAPLLMLLASGDQQKKIQGLKTLLAEAEKQNAAQGKDASKGTWTLLRPHHAKTTGGATLITQADGSLVATGANPATEAYEFIAQTDLTNLTGVRIEALADPSLPGNGPGRANNGNFVMTGIEVEAAPVLDPAKFQKVKVVSAEADYAQKDFGIEKAIDADAKSGWAVDGNEKHENRSAWFSPEKPFGFAGGTLIRVRLRFESQFAQHAIGRPRLAVTADPISIRSTKLPAEIDRLKKEIKAEEKKLPSVMVMQQMDKPRATHILVRGQYNQPGELVEPGVPAALGALPPDAPKNRLSLARWITDPKHPLMARVTVNRFWKNIMGTGIVKTANDFGSQAEWPSHPELLDWLACEFIESGWDVKHMIKLIVTSAAYQQSSRVTPELHERDPYNRLYARGPRFRLGAEEVRDTALAVSGLLDGRVGGASVSPYQPAGLWEELSSRGDSKKWTAQFFEQSHGPDLYRRSMYTFWKRTCPPPQMQAFDAPDREVCTVNRDRTNTPLQALVTLNDPTYIEAARKLAERTMAQPGTPADRVRGVFRLATARLPVEREQAMLVALYEKMRVRYGGQRDEALKLLAMGEAPRDEKLDPTELAAWTIVVNTILNLDESLTKG